MQRDVTKRSIERVRMRRWKLSGSPSLPLVHSLFRQRICGLCIQGYLERAPPQPSVRFTNWMPFRSNAFRSTRGSCTRDYPPCSLHSHPYSVSPLLTVSCSPEPPAPRPPFPSSRGAPEPPPLPARPSRLEGTGGKPLSSNCAPCLLGGGGGRAVCGWTKILAMSFPSVAAGSLEREGERERERGGERGRDGEREKNKVAHNGPLVV